MDESWRAWIFENLTLGCDPDGMRERMLAEGLDPVAVAREMAAAMQSPFLLGARRATEQLQNRVRKRDWLLDVYRHLHAQRPGALEVPRRSRLAFEEFAQSYYLQNAPVIITDMLDEWPAMTRWSFAWLQEHFGEREVEVQAGRTAVAQYEIVSERLRRPMRFGEFLQVVASGVESNELYMTANNSSRNKEALRELWRDVGGLETYLQPGAGEGFLWIGPRGTITPFHHDLTSNFMAQIRGRKRVRMIPACDLPHVYNDLHCFTPVDGEAIDYDRFPGMRNARVIECELAPGEILFLPVAWWHHVRALDPSITVSLTHFRLSNAFSSFYSTYDRV